MTTTASLTTCDCCGIAMTYAEAVEHYEDAVRACREQQAAVDAYEASVITSAEIAGDEADAMLTRWLNGQVPEARYVSACVRRDLLTALGTRRHIVDLRTTCPLPHLPRVVQLHNAAAIERLYAR